MNKQLALENWRGICIPIPTLYKDNENRDLNIEGFKKNIQFLIDRGANKSNSHFLVAAAGGDFPLITLEERIELAIAAKEIAKDIVPVMISAQDTNLNNTLKLAKICDEHKIAGIQVSPPYYEKPADHDVLNWFSLIDKEISHTGMVVYNTWWQGYELSLEMIEKITQLDNVVSLKWSTSYIRTTIEGYRRFSKKVAIIDNEMIPPYGHLLGSIGYVSHTSNFWPEFEWKIWDLMEKRNYTLATKMLETLNTVFSSFKNSVNDILNNDTLDLKNYIKIALNLTGLESGPLRKPLQTINMTNAQRSLLLDTFKQSTDTLYSMIESDEKEFSFVR